MSMKRISLQLVSTFVALVAAGFLACLVLRVFGFRYFDVSVIDPVSPLICLSWNHLMDGLFRAALMLAPVFLVQMVSGFTKGSPCRKSLLVTGLSSVCLFVIQDVNVFAQLSFPVWATVGFTSTLLNTSLGLVLIYLAHRQYAKSAG